MINDIFNNYKNYLENLNIIGLNNLDDYVSQDIEFRDPFHSTIGIEEMRNVFLRLFSFLNEIEFLVLDSSITENIIFYEWSLTGVRNKKKWKIEGITKLQINNDGLVIKHFEHWDSATQFYEQFPVLGMLLRNIRKLIRKKEIKL